MIDYKNTTSIGELVGKTLTNVSESDGQGLVNFFCSDGSEYALHHFQDCCESVVLDDRCGEWDEIIGSEILTAEEVSNMEGPTKPSDYGESYTWTFYRITTMKGQVVLRFLGESNGYYSESVDFVKIR